MQEIIYAAVSMTLLFFSIRLMKGDFVLPYKASLFRQLILAINYMKDSLFK